MKYLLDTNICIYAMKHHPNVLLRMQQAKREGLCVSAIVAAELAFGVARSATAYREKNQASLTRFLGAITVQPWPTEAVWVYGPLRQSLRQAGTPVGELDLLIAAHAQANELIVVTNNTREFERIEGLKLENWIE
ncbi:MAG: type II toxin-antitoxin system VapC family toxin [Hydrogenophaga sp.]